MKIRIAEYHIVDADSVQDALDRIRESDLLLDEYTFDGWEGEQLPEGYQECELNGARIRYWYMDGRGYPLDEVSREHIKECLADGYIEGELFMREPSGWWAIARV